MTETHWFRCVVHHFASVDEWGDVNGSYAKVDIIKCKVRKHTPKGAWLFTGFESPDIKGKFVLRDMQHRGRAYAAPTEEQAKKDFILRKQFHIDRLQAQINRATADQKLVEFSLVTLT